MSVFDDFAWYLTDLLLLFFHTFDSKQGIAFIALVLAIIAYQCGKELARKEYEEKIRELEKKLKIKG